MIHRFSLADQSKPIGSQASFRSDIERRNSPFQVFDPDSQDIAMAMKVAQEIIHTSGAEVTVYARTEHEGYDKVWEEDADPTYKGGVHLKAYFVPKPLEAQLRPWGVDVENQTTLVFCREEIFKTFGKRMIREGDIVEVPFNSAIRKIDRFRVLNTTDSGNFRYTWLYLSCHMENITDDKAIDINHK